MTEIPTWWLVLSGVFFFMNALLFLACACAAVYLISFMRELSPRIATLEKSLQELIAKIQAVTERVEGVAASLRDTVESVGGKAKHVAGSAEMVASSASRQFERVSPIVTGVLTTIKIIRAIQSLKQARAAKKEHASRKKGSIAVFKR
jgi:methyl-accepting chemotaxis protein